VAKGVVDRLTNPACSARVLQQGQEALRQRHRGALLALLGCRICSIYAVDLALAARGSIAICFSL
jgi:hypothetical protein